MKSIFLFLVFLLSIPSSSYSEELKKPFTILYVGDSHSYGNFGKTLDTDLEKISAHVIMESSCGSAPLTWLGHHGYQKTVCGFWKKDGTYEVRTTNHQTPIFTEEIKNYRPNVVIVQLGTNIAADDNPLNAKNSIEEMMKDIIVENSLCIWIGPPDANSKIVTKEKLASTNSLLKKLADENKCQYVDSLALTHYPKNDKEGIHYPPQDATNWALKIIPKINTLITSFEDQK